MDSEGRDIFHESSVTSGDIAKVVLSFVSLEGILTVCPLPMMLLFRPQGGLLHKEYILELTTQFRARNKLTASLEFSINSEQNPTNQITLIMHSNILTHKSDLLEFMGYIEIYSEY